MQCTVYYHIPIPTDVNKTDSVLFEILIYTSVSVLIFKQK